MHLKQFATIGIVVIAVLAIGCGISKDKYAADIAAIQTQLDGSRHENVALRSDIAELQSEKEALHKQLANLENALQNITGERDALAKAERMANARLETFRNILTQFQSMIKAGKISIKIRDNKMIVEMESAILFPSGKAKLSKPGKAALTDVAEVLGTIQGRLFQVAGHTDNVPVRSRKFKDNWNLSSARAVAVVRHLIDSGMVPGVLSSAGYADTQPVADNETEEGRAQNRRIEIILQPNLEELPSLAELEKMLE